MAGNLNRTVTTVYGANTRRGTFAAPAFANDMIDLIDYVAETLAGSQMIAVDSPQLAPPAPALPIVGVATPSATADPDGSAERVAATPPRSRDLRSAEAIPDQDRFAIAIGRLGLDGWTDERLGKPWASRRTPRAKSATSGGRRDWSSRPGRKARGSLQNVRCADGQSAHHRR